MKDFEATHVVIKDIPLLSGYVYSGVVVKQHEQTGSHATFCYTSDNTDMLFTLNEQEVYTYLMKIDFKPTHIVSRAIPTTSKGTIPVGTKLQLNVVHRRGYGFDYYTKDVNSRPIFMDTLYLSRDDILFHLDIYSEETQPSDMILPTDAKERKDIPITTGVLDYFPLAIAEVAKCSKAGNDQHNPNQSLYWDKTKSTDHADCLSRHLIDRGSFDTDGIRHSAKLAWRALALLQIELENEQKKGTSE